MSAKTNISLNESQSKALVKDGHVLVLAGAGSGKTRVLTQRIASMVNQAGVNPYNILAITFTNKASNEMKARLNDVTDCAHKMWISTIHSMCAKILRFEAESLGFSADFSIYDESDSEKLLKRIVAEQGISDEKFYKHAAYHISNAKSYAMTPEEYNNNFLYERSIDDIVAVFKVYQKKLKAANSMDFDDLLYNAYFLLRDHCEVREKYAERFKYISVDEFQDISFIQYEILKFLQSLHQNLFVVGDDDQSIYGWRGAEVKNILNFPKDFPDAKVFKLEQNYRSTKKILSLANHIIKKNSVRHEKELWTENQEGVKIDMYSGYNESEEAYQVVQQIESLVRHNGFDYNDFAILMRINAITRSFEQECNKYAIPYRMFGGFKFFERKEIKDITAYLKVVANPMDDQALLRIINVPKRGIGESTIAKLTSLASQEGCSLLEVVYNTELIGKNFSKSLKEKLATFAQLIFDLIEYKWTHTLTEIVSFVVKKVGLLESFAGSDEEENRRQNLEELVSAVQEFSQQNPSSTLSEFLQSVTMASERGSEEGSAVTIATVHAAKGLEFRVVFVVGLEDGVFPAQRAKYETAQMEEERRLMYVAVTRAKERLYLTRARNRFMYGKTQMTVPSPFFTEAESFVKVKEVDIYADPPKQATLTQSKFKAGQLVHHKIYGIGNIIIVKGEFADVAFKGAGVKTLHLTIAPLEILK